MSNPILINQGTQTAVAVDTVGTVNYQVVKLDVGTAGGSAPLGSANPLFVKEQYIPGYEDDINNIARMEQHFSYASGSTAGIITIKPSSGFVHTLTVWGGSLGGMKLTDDTSGTTGNVILPNGTATAAVPFQITLDEVFTQGLTLTLGTTTYWNISYR